MCSNKTVQKIRVTELKNEMIDIQIMQRKTLHARVDVVATTRLEPSTHHKTTRPRSLKPQSSLNQASIKPQACFRPQTKQVQKGFQTSNQKQWARRLPDISY
jgi:hypothetical protein